MKNSLLDRTTEETANQALLRDDPEHDGDEDGDRRYGRHLSPKEPFLRHIAVHIDRKRPRIRERERHPQEKLVPGQHEDQQRCRGDTAPDYRKDDIPEVLPASTAVYPGSVPNGRRNVDQVGRD